MADRVAAILTARIRSGIYRVGDLLPTERTLAAELQVHRRSVRTAVDHLVFEGSVSRRPNGRPAVERSLINQPVFEQDAVRPTKVAQRMTTRKTPSPRISAFNLIALLMWHGGGPLEHSGTSQQRIFWGMNQALTKIGPHAVFLDIGNHVVSAVEIGDHIGSEEENAAREAEHLRYIRDQKFGGALFYPYAYRRNRELIEEVSRSVPLVLLDRKIEGVDVDFVGIENHAASFEVTQHLIAQGHRRIAHITRQKPIKPVQDRIQGYLDAMRSPFPAGRNGAEQVAEMVLHVPPYSDDRAWAVVDAVFRLPEGQRPTAATCVSDYIAVGKAERLKSLGLSIPRDVALTGFDNIVPTLLSGIRLTTVAQPYEDIKIKGVELLMRRIKDKKAFTASVELPARLIERTSNIPSLDFRWGTPGYQSDRTL